MSEEQRKKGFLSWVLGEEADQEGTVVYSKDDVGISDLDESQEPHGFTVERADEIIQDLPSDVPRASAVTIVRRTLSAAGIDVEDLRRSSSRREAKLSSEIELSQGRMQELREKTDEHIASLEREIRKAREDRDSGVNKEEKRISRARTGLEKVERVREFFSLPKDDAEQEQQSSEPSDTPQRPDRRSEQQRPERRSRPSAGEETQVMNAVGRDEEEPGEETQAVRHQGPLSEEQSPEEPGPRRGSEQGSSRSSRGERGNGERGGSARRNRNPKDESDR